MPSQATCPLFESGCPYASSIEESSAFKSYLDQCKMFSSGCPFKDLDVLSQIKSIIASGEFSQEYAEQVLTTHKNLSSADLKNLKEVCPAFKDGCIFSSSPGNTLPENNSCPVWKNGCPFKIVMSNGSMTLIESLQSNSWDILVRGSLIGETPDDDDNEYKPSEQESLMLASMLKEGTQKSHSLAESVQFVKRFRKKQITWELYQLLIRDLYFVYATMEELLDKLSETNENVRSLNYPELKRKESLEQDLEFFYGSDWKTKIMESSPCYQDPANMSPATANYVARLRYCAKQPNGGELLLSHAYTRYLGDLSGGQLLKRMTRRSLDLKAQPRNATTEQIKQLSNDMVDGTRFYDFFDIEDLVKFKISYR